MIANTPQAWSERAKSSVSWDAALWSAEGQKSRFAAVVGALNPQPGETLLDYGCGTGAFTEQIRDDVQYVGYDWATGMIARAERDHPYRDFTRLRPACHYDLIAAIGPFNLPHRWCKCRTWETLADLWAQCGRAMAVSLYAGTSWECLIYTEVEARAFGETTDAGHVAVERHLSNDLLLMLYR